MNPATGAAENHKIGLLLNQTAGVEEWLIDEPGWECIYDQVIKSNPNGTGPNNTIGYDDFRTRDSIREGMDKRAHVVSTRHLNKMVQQLTRLIIKYSASDAETGIDWSTSELAQFLVEILTEHRTEIQAELDATNPNQMWAHSPKPNWVVFPMCGHDDEGRRVWDYKYPHEYSGPVFDMFPDVS